DPQACTLTCHWHNWKFDLRSGEALVGQDPVRTYPPRIEDGQVMVEISPPDPQLAQQRLMASLKAGFDERQYGRITRVLARMHYQGLDPLSSLRAALLWSYDRFEFGMGHATAVAADWAQLYLQADDLVEQLSALSEALDYLSLESLRQPQFAYALGQQPYTPAALLQAIEQEDEASAVQLLRGGLSAGLSADQLLDVLAQAALAHYNDFGHSLIYVAKTRELLQQLGPELSEALLLSLVRALIYATREDLLPEFRDYAPSAEVLADLSWGTTDQPPALDQLLGASVKQALQWVLTQSTHHRPEAIYQTLLAANAHSLLYYDLRYQQASDGAVGDNIGWLDFTHALTFANALRQQAERDPARWRAGLLQLAAFYGRNTGYLDLSQSVDEWQVDDESDFWQQIRAQIFDHGVGVPIFAAHLLKTARAVQDESPLLPPPLRAFLLAALKRFLQSPIKQKHVRRTLKQSLKLVGKDY
ncbi:MAG: hypothetical protein CVV27_08625, partial [Candidatus Melainabacteria bacterium HGW-Melainabacteria-1]